MKTATRSWGIGLALVMLAGLANATIITVDPANYEAGTNLSNVTPGVTLSNWSWSGLGSAPAYTPIYASDCTGCADAFAGQIVFGRDRLSNNPVFSDGARATQYLQNVNEASVGFTVFRADFDSPTNFVQMLVGGYGAGEPPYVAAFDREGHLLAQCELLTHPLDPCGVAATEGSITARATMVTLDTHRDNIAFIVSGGVSAGSRVASLTFVRSVPEPEIIALWALGLTMLVSVRRQRRAPIRD